MNDRRDYLASGALRSWFLGPRGENAELLERLLLETFRDHVFWRRNNHPEDGLTIRESDRRHPGYDEGVARLTEELQGLLAALKSDVPFFSGRYQGHMIAEQTIASQLGYLAGMLYNPNNVTAEVSPVTTEMELDVARELALMVGLPPTSWGHLTSGGTVANFEALWIARSVRYLPVGLAMAARELGVAVNTGLPNGGVVDLRELSLWQLLNILPSDALDCYDAFHAALPKTEARKALERNSLSALGYQDYTRRLAGTWNDPLPPSVVLVPSTAHYSWEKIVRALGIGANRLLRVPVDCRARMDLGALDEILDSLAQNRTAVLALVSVCGTTEEGAVDQLDLVHGARAKAADAYGTAFFLHADACFGGYAAALTRDSSGQRMTGREIRNHTESEWPSDEWVAAVSALSGVDSISIDPHKLGYVPYPAGVFLMRDKRARNLVSLDPPYLSDGDSANDEGFIGRWILEGSKPGAAAASVWLSHRVVPLNVDGYGHLLARSAAGARRLHDSLTAEGALGDCTAVCVAEPDLNVLAFLVVGQGIESADELNELNEAIYRALSPGSNTDNGYWLTKTRLTSPDCDGILEPLARRIPGGAAGWADHGMVLLRCTVMDPFFVEGVPSPDHCGGLIAAIANAAQSFSTDS